jgi:biopolymer transport protein ExbB
MAGSASAIAPQAVMSSIAEALVATAIGLGVAIPAVVAYNMFERTVKSALEDAEVLSREILSYLESRNEVAPSSVREPASQQKHGSMLRRAASMS